MEEVLQRLGETGGDWGQKLKDKLANMSPTSMKVTLRMMQEGARKETLSECLKMECRLVMRCCEDQDFYEGVRALLVDRDNKPK